MEMCFDAYKSLSAVIIKSKKQEYLDTYGSQKSFYKKAQVLTMENGDEVLVSYTTPIAYWVKETNAIIRLQDRDEYSDRYNFSATTMNHVRAFMTRHNMDWISKAEWKKHT